MLADENAAVVDKVKSGLSLESDVEPRVGVGDLHGGGGANRTCAEIEGGHTGNNFSIVEGSDITDNGLVCGDGAVLDHLIDLHTCGNAGKITALIDIGKCIVEIGDILGVSLYAGSVAELNVGIFLCGLKHKLLMTEGVCENNVAAFVNKLCGSFIALVALGNVGLDKNLFVGETELLLNALESLNEVVVVGGIFVVQADKTDLEIGVLRVRLAFVVLLAAAGSECRNHNNSEKQCENLFHLFVSSNFFILKAAVKQVQICLYRVA